MSAITPIGGPAWPAGTTTTAATAGTHDGGPPRALLPDPTASLVASGDPGAMVAALGIESASDEEKVSRDIQDAETTLQEHEEAASVAAMRQKASDMRTDAIGVALLGGLAGGLSLAGAGSGTQAANGLFKAGGELVTTVEGFVKSLGDAHAVDMDARCTELKDAAQHASTAASQSYDAGRDAKKLLDAAVDYYREYSSAKEQSQAAAAFKS